MIIWSVKIKLLGPIHTLTSNSTITSDQTIRFSIIIYWWKASDQRSMWQTPEVVWSRLHWKFHYLGGQILVSQSTYIYIKFRIFLFLESNWNQCENILIGYYHYCLLLKKKEKKKKIVAFVLTVSLWVGFSVENIIFTVALHFSCKNIYTISC